MSIQIAAKRLSGGTGHQHISNLLWTDDATKEKKQSTTATIVSWIENNNGQAHTGQGASAVKVGVVTPSTGPKYLRTYANGKWTDNLLALPNF